MKKIILAVILLAAAGGGIYYLLGKKQHTEATTINKEFVFGKWKIDSLVSQTASAKNGLGLLLFAIDSTAKNEIYDFQNDGNVVVSVASDTIAKKDTSRFSWGTANQFLWKETITDTDVDTMTVVKLDKQEFVLQSSDSTLIYLKKLK
ncbi:MAG TPA: hypothetical protein VFP97_03940 [Chitinophagaceae bacterium]|nr:hypothetical protein [Chitinophagaceae bacterium]